jgi:hypothetical protein
LIRLNIANPVPFYSPLLLFLPRVSSLAKATVSPWARLWRRHLDASRRARTRRHVRGTLACRGRRRRTIR